VSLDEYLGYDEKPSQEELDAAAKLHIELDKMIGLIKTTFESPSGRDVLDFLAAYCRQVSPSYVQGDPMQTAYNEGRRSVILKLMNYLHMDDRTMIEESRRLAQRRTQ